MGNVCAGWTFSIPLYCYYGVGFRCPRALLGFGLRPAPIRLFGWLGFRAPGPENQGEILKEPGAVDETVVSKKRIR